MKQADEAIEKVLAGLRASDAPEGMQGRILQAMQARAAAETGRNQAWWMVFRALPLFLRKDGAPAGGTGFAWARIAGGSALLAGLLVVVAVLAPRHRGLYRDGKTPTLIQRTESRAAVVAGKRGPMIQAQEQPRMTKPVLVRAKSVPAGQRVAPVTDSNAAEDALAREEMLAPSHPAPPLPMTAQEKLLVRVVRQRDPDELAMLNPEEREKAAARDDEAFKKFFKIPDPAKPQDTDSPAADSAPEVKPEPAEKPSSVEPRVVEPAGAAK
jgi:hypothetical protein